MNARCYGSDGLAGEPVPGMNRRYFFLSLAALPLSLRSARKAARITRIRIVPIEGRFHNFVAMNSHDKRPKGQTYEHPLIRIETDEGMEGVGAGTYAKPDAA